MKRTLIYLASLAVLMPGLAAAQATAPMCIPTVNGYVQGMPIVRESYRYCHVYWLCNNKGGEEGAVEGLSWPKATVAGCTTDAIYKAVWPRALDVHTASAKVGTAHAAWGEKVSFDCYNKAEANKTLDRRRMCVERHTLLKANKRAWWPQVTDWVK